MRSSRTSPAATFSARSSVDAAFEPENPAARKASYPAPSTASGVNDPSTMARVRVQIASAAFPRAVGSRSASASCSNRVPARATRPGSEDRARRRARHHRVDAPRRRRPRPASASSGRHRATVRRWLNPLRCRSTSTPSTRSTIETDRGPIVMELDPQARAEHRQPLRRAGPRRLLRRAHVPPGGARVRDPGRRSRGHGRGGPGYKFDDEPVEGRVHARRGRDGQRRARTPTARSSSSASTTAGASSTTGLQPVRLRDRRHRRGPAGAGRAT